MKVVFLITLGLLSLSANAQSNRKDPAFEIQVDPEHYDPNSFRRRGFAAEAFTKREPSSFDLPSRQARDAAFAKVEGLAGEIRDFDELARDILYVDARNAPAETLEARYGKKISPAHLAALKKALK